MSFSERYKSHHDASRDLKNRYTADTAGRDYLPAVLSETAKSRRVIYLHVPFCVKKCTYCDFVSFPEQGRADAYFQALY